MHNPPISHLDMPEVDNSSHKSAFAFPKTNTGSSVPMKRKPFTSPTISVPVDILEVTKFFLLDGIEGSSLPQV